MGGETMNTLLRVGDKVVNTATVTHIKLNDSGGAVSIEFVGGTGLKVRGKDAAHLRAWLTDPECVERALDAGCKRKGGVDTK
jgi:hypothetical protein